MKREFQWLTEGPRTVVTISEADFRRYEPQHLWKRLRNNGAVVDGHAWLVTSLNEEPSLMVLDELLTLYPQVSVIADDLEERLAEGDPSCYVRVVLENNGITVSLPPAVNQRCYRFEFSPCNMATVHQPDHFDDYGEDEDVQWRYIGGGTWDEGLALLSEALKGVVVLK